MGINCLISLYRNSFGANQRLALTRKSFRIGQVSQRSNSQRLCCSVGFDNMHVCTDLLCVVCIGLLYAEFSAVMLNSQLWTQNWVDLCFRNLCVV